MEKNGVQSKKYLTSEVYLAGGKVGVDGVFVLAQQRDFWGEAGSTEKTQ